MRAFAFVVALLFTPPAHALEVLLGQSTLGFSVRLGEQEITASFKIWSAEVDLENQLILVTVDTASATTDSPLLDTVMQSAGWIDSNTYPTATFISLEINALADGFYTARGNLLFKGETLPTRVTISKIVSSVPQTYDVKTSVDRTAVGMTELIGALDQHVSINGLIVVAP